jgi:hypothetical protein
MNISADMPIRPFTVQGVELQIPEPFKAGHTCTEGEASSLNQTLVENVRNNLANDVAEALKRGEAAQQIQKLVDEYVAEYEFGVKRGGLRISDPIESAAREIAIEYAKRAVRKAGKVLKDYGMDQIRADAERALADPTLGPKIRAKAEQVAAAKAEALDL